MTETLNFFFLLVCIIVLSVGLVIAGGRISKLEGEVDSLLIYLKKAKANDDENRRGKDG